MPSRPVGFRLPSTLLLLATLVPAVAAQSGEKRPLTIDDYSRWRTIQTPSISGDGGWIAYTLQLTNVRSADEKPLLRLMNLATRDEVEIEGARDAQFSRDSRWIVYRVDSVPAGRPSGSDSVAAAGDDAQDTTRREAAPPKIALRELASGRTRAWEGMEDATFNHGSTHLLLKRRAPARGSNGGNGSNDDDERPGGVDWVLHDLAADRSLHLGDVGDASFNRQGDLLAYAVDATVKDGNGLFLMGLADDRVRVLDNDTLIYDGLAWSDDGDRIAALKGHPVEKMRERDNTLVAFSNLRTTPERATPATLGTSADGFPEGFVLSERAPLSWSEDGRRVYFGILQQTPEPESEREPSRDSVANVDVWRTQDERVQSVQMIRAERDRNFTFRQAFDAVDQRYVTLTDSAMRTVDVADAGHWAVGFDDRAYVADTAFAKADLYRVDTRTGERTLMMEGQLVGAHSFGITPDGRRFLYWKDDRYQAYDLERGTSTTLPGGQNGEFLNAEWDYVGPRPAYGVEGFSTDGRGVIVRERYDLVLLPFDGSAPRSITNGEGARREVQFRHARTEPIPIEAPRRTRTAREIDLSRPVTLSAYGQWSKKDGFYRLANGRLEELVFDDARFGSPTRAEQADRLMVTRQTYREFPDLQVSGPAFEDLEKVSDANPQQAEYVWGRTVLVDYENADGVRLQGVLALPDDYVTGERRPMIVTFYEKNSQNLHTYPAPRYMTGMGALSVEALSRGYLTLLADVHFRTGSSHSDMLESVEAATRKVIEMGYADPARIGVHGHSYGGEGAAFIGTRSKMFAAVGMGAGVTDLESDFNQMWGWSYQVSGGSGAPGSDYYLFGQGRWGTDPYRDPDLYRFESAITHAPEAVAPFLIMHGTDDPTVQFQEGVNFYQALRYNGKEAYLLAYPGEGHGLRGIANRRDLTVRYFEFFDHFLRDQPAPAWMTDGVSFLVKERSR